MLKPGSEVRYLRAGDQTIDASLAYRNLTLEGSGNKTVNSAISIQDQFTIQGSARFVNYDKNITCGSSLTNNSSMSHSFGTGTYTFTGTTIGGTAATAFDNATLSFTGASITLGDGAVGNGNLTFKNVSLSNPSTGLVIGANGYTGTAAFTGLLSMTGTNAMLTVSGGTTTMNALSVSGTASSVSFEGGAAKHNVTGNVTCGNLLTIGTPLGIQGNLSVAGNLVITSDLDVSGSATVSGPVVNMSGGNNVFLSGFTHSSTAPGSTCIINSTYSDGTGLTATTLNAATVQLQGTLSINNLIVPNASGTLTATTSFSVANTVSLAKDLVMTAYQLTFPASAPQNAISGTGEVIGTVRRTLQATGSYTFNGAYITLLIPTLASAEDYDFKLAKVAPDQQAVTRCYDISRVSGDITPASWLYTLGLHYNDSELNGNDENTLMLAYGALYTAGENQFTKIVGSSANTISNIVTFVFDGLTSFNHRYAMADLNKPLPVELVSFSARRKDETVDLRWKTATELNNFGFEVERAMEKDGPYAALGFVEGQGSKNSPTDYSFQDMDAPAAQLFYRLRQVDRDGSVTYSPIVEVLAGSTRFEMGNYPNPFNPSTTITFQSPADGRATLAVYNALGERVAVAYDADVRQNESVSVPFEASALPGGAYFYTVTIGTHTQTGKMLLTK